MNTANLKTFAQYARRYLKEQISGKIQHVLSTDSAVQRENPKAVAELKKKIANTSTGQVIDKVAYIWFNRFCALRFLDVNRYNRMGILSPAEGQSQPEILAEAKMGHIDEVMVPEAVRRRVVTLLNGSTPSPDPQGEAYRLLLVAACNDCHKTMPYMFEKIADYTELLMPDDLLSDNSILSYIRETMTPEACEDVEVIGWLYQYYISEKKDEVFDGLKKGIKIMPENIPAATQLFTPHWIVRYLVENSVGRLWLLNRPHSKLADRMDYYIKPEQPETDFLKIGSPEELKICDPACGSGHMLTYAFDLLYFIYEEEGYSSAEIPTKILTHNLYGIEIDERAGSLASFALAMKARAQNRGFFRQRVSPNICVLETVQFETGEIQTYIDAVGRTLFTNSMKTTLRQFEEADNFGSLIRPDLKNAADILQLITSINLNNNLFLQVTHEKVLKVFRQVDYLCPKYEVVIANPPYMSSNGMNNRLKTWAESNFANSKTDLFAMFIERNLDLVRKYGLVAMITMQGWMFLSSFEKLRKVLLSNSTILSMAHLGERAFDSIGGVVVSTSAYVIQNACHNTHKAEYLRLVDGNSEIAKATATKEAIENPDCGWFFRTSIDDIKKIPEWPIAYWLSAAIRGAYNDTKIGEKYEVKEGLGTRDDSRFLRYYWEVGFKNIRMDYQAHEKWVPVDKAGGYRKWFGSNYTVMNWFDDGYEIRNFEKSVPRNIQYFFRPAVSWGKVSTGRPSFRYRSDLFAFVDAAPSAFSGNLELLIAALNSNAMSKFLKIQGDTVNVTVGAAKNLPLPSDVKCDPALKCIQLARNDWNAYETSWDFTKLDLLCPKYRQATLAKSYSCLRQYWRNITVVMQSLEEENNRNFIEAYGLRDELTSEVPFKEITLTCNPHYRYGNDKTEAELEALLLTDTMIEFISYAVGCMFGRYALEKPGLILANQGETLEDYLRQIPEPSFPADQDNVIPIIEGDWFAEDIAARFRRFLRLTFGEEKFAENLRFIEEAIGKDIAKYFAKDFYNDHLKRYKKRPIYWLFSSPKGSFNALIYMHRYRPDTVSIILNDYLREYRTKLSARKAHMEQVSISGSVSVSEKTKALKEIENLKKVLDELMQYERDVIYPLAAQKLEIDLDDGVKVNYLKFGAALRKIPGLDAGEE